MVAAAVVAVGALAFAGCGSGGSGQAAGGGDRLDVVATTPVVADFVRNVGGDRVHVVQILKPGVDPHDYEASPADIQAIADADLVVESGVGLEAAWLDDTVSSAGYDGEVVDASHGVKVRTGNGDEEQKAGDPHIWHDPANARIMVGDIAAALAAKDPAGKAGYAAQRGGVRRQARARSTPRTRPRSARSRSPSASWSPTTTRSATTARGTGSRSSARSSRASTPPPSCPATSCPTSSRRSSGPACGRSSRSPRCRRRPRRRWPPRPACRWSRGRTRSTRTVSARPALPGATYLGAERHNTETIVKALGGRV